MKSPPTIGSSSNSPDSKKDTSQLTGSGVKKSSARPKKSDSIVHSTGGRSLRDEKEWQAYFGSACNVSADNETVRARLFDALKEQRAKKETEKTSPADAGECPGYDVKGLMSQIYQDIYSVAAAQEPKTASEEAQTERVFLGELSKSSLLLREVSDRVENVIKSALAHLYSLEYPQPSEILDHDERIARCFSYEFPASERYYDLAARHSWKFLSKLAHSAAFRKAARTLDAPTWQIITTSIDGNAVSLNVFTECHALDWWTPLIRLHSLFPPSPSYNFTKHQPLHPKKPSPHKWVVTPNLQDVHRPTFEGKTQIHTPNNIYRDRSFASAPRPPCWPPNRPYPEDPTLVRANLKSPACTIDTCSFHSSPDIWHALVELRSYGRKGVGVRALERIPRNAILGEYVGELFPAAYAGDPVYALDFSLPGCGLDEVVATISSKRWGNWTRFVNHSCDAATRFRVVVVGGRCRMVVQAVRDIEVFEEVTVDYGDGYWRGRVCECGVEGCYSTLKSKVEGPEACDVKMVVCED